MPSSQRPLAVLLFTVFLDLLGFGLIIPLLPLFATNLGASGLEVGLLMTTYSAMQFLFAPVWGRLSDRIGRRPVLLISIAGGVVSMLLFAASTSLALLFVARTFAGLSNANLGTAQAYIADVTPPEDRARGMGLMGAAFGLGFVLGPSLGGLLAGWGWQAPALAAAALSLLNLIGAAVYLPESLPPELRAEAARRRVGRWEALRGALGRPVLPALFLLFLLVTVGFSQIEAIFSLFTAKRFGYGVTENGWIFAFIGVVLVIVQGGLVHPLQKRLGEPTLLIAGQAVLLLALLALPHVTTIPALFAGAALLALGNGLQSPALSSLVSRRADPGEQGAILGVYQSAGSLGRIVGPAIAGFAFDAGDTLPFHIGAALLLVCVALSLGLQLRHGRAIAAPAPSGPPAA